MNLYEFLIEKYNITFEIGKYPYGNPNFEDIFNLFSVCGDGESWDYYDEESIQKTKSIKINLTATDKELFYTRGFRSTYFRIRGRKFPNGKYFDILKYTHRDLVRMFSSHVPRFVCPVFTNIYYEQDSSKYWAFPDGTLAGNGITDMPFLDEILPDFVNYAVKLPFLDISVFITKYFDIPLFFYSMDCTEDDYGWDFTSKYDNRFLSDILFAVHYHDGQIDILGNKDAANLYKSEQYISNEELHTKESPEELNVEIVRRFFKDFGLNFYEIINDKDFAIYRDIWLK